MRCGPAKSAARSAARPAAFVLALLAAAALPLTGQEAQERTSFPALPGWWAPAPRGTVWFAATSTSSAPTTLPGGEGELPRIPGMSPAEVRKSLESVAKEDPGLWKDFQRAFPQLTESMSEPTTRPAPKLPTTQQLADAQARRRQAEALVKRLAAAATKDLAEIEGDLADLGPEAMVPLKLAELSDNFELRQRAGRISRRLRWRLACPPRWLEAQPKLVEVMSGEDAEARSALVDKIAEAGDAEAVGFLGECLADAQPYVRQRAIDGLVAAAGTGYEPSASARRKVLPYLEAALEDDDRNIRLLAVAALVKIDAVEVRRLAEMLDDESLEVRATVIRAMGHSGDTKAIAFVKPLLADRQWRIRAAALETLSNLAGEKKDRAKVAPAIVERLGDADPFVRSLAAKTLGEWRYNPSAETLLKLAEAGKIPESAAFASLAKMRHAPALKLLLGRYRQAEAPARRIELLEIMTGYDPDAEVDRLVSDALTDDSLTSARPRLIEIAGQRGSWQRFYPQVCKFLLSEDEEVAQAAWEVLRYRSYSGPVPAEITQRLLAWPDPTRATWALQAAYIYNDATLPGVLEQALGSPAPQVAAMALAMLAQDHFGNSLGAELPEYRREIAEAMRAQLEPGRAVAPRRRKLPQRLAELAGRAMSRPDPAVRLRAAALLYRSGADAGAKVRQALSAGLKEAEPALRAIALAGIVEKPGPFLGEIDLIAASRDPQTAEPAIEIMANSGEAEHTRQLIELAGEATHENQTLMEALIRSGDEQAVALAAEKFAKVEGYELTSFARRLAGMPGPGPVKFLAAVRGKADRYEKTELVKVVVTLPDPSVKPLLKEMLKDKDLEVYDEERSRILGRLAELDPAEGIPTLRKMLVTGSVEEQRSAIQAITKAKPAEPMVTMALAAARQRRDQLAEEWRDLAWWVPKDDLRKRFLPALGELNMLVQEAVLRRMTTDLAPADLEVLVQGSAAHAFSREYLAALVAVLTAEHPDRRPGLEKLPGSSLACVLSAVGDWRDATRVLAPFANDARAEVASAARRGLALHLLAYPAAKAEDAAGAQRDALIAAVKSPDAVTAYLAAEALATRWKDALTRIDPAEIPSVTASVRQAVAFGADPPPVARSTVKGVLQGRGGATAYDLALISAAQSPGPDYPLRAARLSLQAADERLIFRAVIAAGEEDSLEFLLDAAVSQADRAAARPLAAKLLEKARKGNTRLFAALAENGWIDPPAEGDLLRLIRAGPAAGAQVYALGQGLRTGEPRLDLALAWAPEQPDERVLELIADDTAAGLQAAAVAAIRWSHPAGRAALLKAATTMPAKRPGRTSARQAFALKALSLSGRPEDAPALLAAHKALKQEDWQQRAVKGSILAVLTLIAPRAAAKALGEAVEEGVYYDLDRQADPDDLLALWADEKDWPANLPVRRESARGDTVSLFDVLTAAKAGMPPPKPPVEFHGPITPEARQLEMATQGSYRLPLAPPWGKTFGDHGDAFAFRRGEEVARSQLQRALAGIRAFGARWEQVSHEPGDLREQFERSMQARVVLADHPIGADGGALLKASPWGAAGPEEYYTAAAPRAAWSVGVYLPPEEVAGGLRTLLAEKSLNVRAGAMRAAADWQITPLADDVARRLAGEGQEVLEAAWALAALRGRQAVQPVLAAYKAQKDFDLRVRLACLLRLLGNDAGRADVERAVALHTTRSFRLKFLQRRSRQPSYGPPQYAQGGIFGEAAEMFGLGVSIADRLLPFRQALEAAAGDSLDRAEAQFPLPPGARADRDAPGGGEPILAAPRSDLSKLHLTSTGLLAADGLRARDLGAGSLSCVDPLEAPLFARLCAAEQELEAHCYVQFADQADDLIDLRERWRAWWSDNRDKPRADWWHQATAQAVAELRHPKWWHRMRAGRRLMRLTGRAVKPPDLFEMPAWAALQADWRKWLKDNASVAPAGRLLAAGVEAGVLEAGAAARATDEGAYLANLVKLAGFAPHPLSDAALLQLQTWPDGRQLARAALPWQHCPRRHLARWARRALRALTGTDRFVYVPGDLPAPAGG